MKGIVSFEGNFYGFTLGFIVVGAVSLGCVWCLSICNSKATCMLPSHNLNNNDAVITVCTTTTDTPVRVSKQCMKQWLTSSQHYAICVSAHIDVAMPGEWR